MVALRKESVDRNCEGGVSLLKRITSLSARRAWIEMSNKNLTRVHLKSLSARRAWIEIKLQRSIDIISQVALRKESVDRNT